MTTAKNKIFRWLFIILIIPSGLYANMSAGSAPSSLSGDIFISSNNSLRVATETISYDISSLNMNAKVDVHYVIVNDGEETFNESMFFIAALHSNIENRKTPGYIVKINGHDTPLIEKEDVKFPEIPGKNTHNNSGRFAGFIFNVQIRPGETVNIDVQYTQEPGWIAGTSYARLSHLINFLSGSRGAKTYSYQIFPVRTFGGGVDEIIIKVKYPLRDTEGHDTEDFQTNLPMNEKIRNKEFCEMEQKFDAVPSDTLEISFHNPSGSKYGLTVSPLYLFSFPDRNNNPALSLSADYLIMHNQISAGLLWNFTDRMQLYQEMKFFQAGYTYYTGSCFDYRMAAGLVEQIRPEKNLGFKLSAGVRALIAFECSYQVFPPWISRKWNHEILLSVPVSF